MRTVAVLGWQKCCRTFARSRVAIAQSDIRDACNVSWGSWKGIEWSSFAETVSYSIRSLAWLAKVLGPEAQSWQNTRVRIGWLWLEAEGLYGPIWLVVERSRSSKADRIQRWHSLNAIRVKYCVETVVLRSLRSIIIQWWGHHKLIWLAVKLLRLGIELNCKIISSTLLRWVQCSWL